MSRVQSEGARNLICNYLVMVLSCCLMYTPVINIPKIFILVLRSHYRNYGEHKGLVVLNLPWIRGSKERSRSSQNSRPQDERAKRAKGEELFPTSLAPPGPAIGFSTATLIQRIPRVDRYVHFSGPIFVYEIH